jgi:hypothetical protein
MADPTVPVLSAGYNPPSKFEVIWGTPDASFYTAPRPTVVTIRTWVPEIKYAPATPPTQRTHVTFAMLSNQAWNTSARSIDPLTPGSYLKFTADQIVGGYLCLGTKEKNGDGSHTFSHGLMIDKDGVRAYERGTPKQRLRLSHSSLSDLRIYRHADNSIVYVATTGQESVVYESTLMCPSPLFIDVYVYGYLYASGDKITSASFETGEVQYGSV